MPYMLDMIKTFKNKAMQRFFETGSSRGLNTESVARIGRILNALDAAERAEDMNLPGFHFHGLSGDQKGRYSVRVTGNWRITFGFDKTDAIDVEFEDYH